MCPLVSIEGIDSAGKSTLVRHLPPLLKDVGKPVVVCGERMSPFGYLLKKEELPKLSPLVKAYLFAADRAWTYEKHCEPALLEGALVIWERYVDSALAYRGADAVVSDKSWLRDLTLEINRPFVTPDLVVFLDIRPESAARRPMSASTRFDLEFVERVLVEYEQLAESGRPYVHVNADVSVVECASAVARVIREKLFPHSS